MDLGVILTFVTGLILGSFLGAVTFRLPLGKQFLKGRSRCPLCETTLSWYDNLPLISYLLLWGRCRSCRKKISPRYPLIEITTAILLTFLYLAFGFNILLLLVTLLSISVFVIDLEKKIIPDGVVFAGFGVTVLFLILTRDIPFYSYLFGGFIASLSLLTIHLLTKGRGMGLGDVKYALFIGTYLGYPFSLIWLFLAFLTGAGVGSILVLAGKAKLGKEIPFGPFLVIAFFLSLFFSESILKWFLI